MAIINPPSAPRLPDASGIDVTDPEQLKTFLIVLTASLTKHIQQRAPVNASLTERLMLAPNGRSFRLKVTDAGAVVTEPFGSAEGAVVPP